MRQEGEYRDTYLRLTKVLESPVGVSAPVIAKALDFGKDVSLTGPFCSKKEFKLLFAAAYPDMWALPYLARYDYKKSAKNRHAMLREVLSYRGVADYISRSIRDSGPLIQDVVAFGDVEALKIIVDRCGIDLKRLDDSKLFKPLLATAVENLDRQEHTGQLNSKNESDMLRYLIESGCSPESMDIENDISPVLSCVTMGNKLEHDIAALKYLLSEGADPNIQDSLGRSALYKAVTRGSLTQIEVLLEYGAGNSINNKTKTDRGDTVFHVAAANRMTSVFPLLLSRGADPAIKDNYGASAFYYAKQARCYEELKRMYSQYKDYLHAKNYSDACAEEIYSRG